MQIAELIKSRHEVFNFVMIVIVPVAGVFKVALASNHVMSIAESSGHW